MQTDNNNKTESELQALNNALNSYNLNGYKIHKYWADDKRKTKQMYFITDDKGNSLTGHWYYTEIQHFIMGYGKAINKAK